MNCWPVHSMNEQFSIFYNSFIIPMFLTSTKNIGILRPFLVRHLNYKVSESFIGTRIDKFVMDKYPYVVNYIYLLSHRYHFP